MATAQDYYQVLGVPRTASQEEIQRAYRTLARRFHPDINKEPGAEDRFKEITEAYEVLSDPDHRARYDRFGPAWRQVPDDYALGRVHPSAPGPAGAGGCMSTPAVSAGRVSVTLVWAEQVEASVGWIWRICSIASAEQAVRGSAVAARQERTARPRSSSASKMPTPAAGDVSR